MTAIHDALRRDLDQLLYATASHAPARARWGTFRSQLRFHLAAERAAMWPRAEATLAGDPHRSAAVKNTWPGQRVASNDASHAPDIAFQGERLEVFPGELLAGGRRTMSSTGAARWPA